MIHRESASLEDTLVAVASSVSIDKVSKAFAAEIRGVESARDAWVSTTPDSYDLWLLVQPIDLAAERDLYALVDRMYERFPSSRFSLHVLNPATFVDLVPERIVPAQARRVGLRASA